MEFGKVLRKMRKGAGMSQEQLSLEMHISRSNISRLESDIYELRAADLIKWCRITNNPEVLMTFIYGADVATQLIDAGASTLISGAIIFLGGIL